MSKLLDKNDIPLFNKIATEQGWDIHQEGSKIYYINPNTFYFGYPKRKDGKPDMRYSINKRSKLLGLI